MSHPLHILVTAVPAGGDNFFTDIQNLSGSAATTAKVLGGAVATILLLVAGIKTRGALGGIAAAAISALLFIWLLSNVNSADIQKKVDNTVNNKGLGVVVDHPAMALPEHPPARLVIERQAST